MELTYPGGAVGTILEFPVSGWNWVGLTANGIKVRVKRPNKTVLERTGLSLTIDIVRGVVGWRVQAGDFDQPGIHQVRLYDIRAGGIAPTLTSEFRIEIDLPAATP